jgi:PAS domain S-box-containing protein
MCVDTKLTVDLAHDGGIRTLGTRTALARAFPLGRQASIAELTRAALEGSSVSHLMQAAVSLIGRVMVGVDYACVGEIGPIGLRQIATHGVAEDDDPRLVEPDASTYVGLCSASAGECTIVTDWDAEVRFSGPAWLQLGCIKSSAFVPIRTYSGEEAFGFLNIHARNAREFPDDEIVYLEIVANVLSVAIAREKAQSVAAQYLEQFRALADNSPDIISRFDRDLRLIYVNGAAERLTGVCADDLVGRTMQDIRIDTPQVRALDLALRQVFRTGTQRMLELEAPTVLGPRTFQTYMAPEFDPDGTVRSIVVAARDITQQQRTEQERVGADERVLARLDELRELITRSHATHRQQIEAVVVQGQLTPRELQILSLIARGWSNREIADDLGVSRGNVKNQVSRLLEKLDVSDRTQAAIQAVRLGLVSDQ